jgi:hypothetical protein
MGVDREHLLLAARAAGLVAPGDCLVRRRERGSDARCPRRCRAVRAVRP